MRPVLIALLAALVVVPAARAESRLRDLGPVVAGPFTDGHRWVAWSPVRGKLTLFDTEKGRAWTQPLRPECEPAGVGGGLLLLACGRPGYPNDSFERPLVVSLRSGASWEPPGVDAVLVPVPSASDQSLAWTGIGGRWLRLRRSGYHWTHTEYLNLSTGRVAEDSGDVDRQPFLDAPGLMMRLCDPLRRPRNRYDDALLTLEYEPPWALLPVASGTVWLARCGRARKRAICRQACDASLSAGVVTWSAGGEIGALVIVSGRRLRWRLPFAGLVVHTANRVFATRSRPSAAPRLLEARLPR